MSWLNEAELAYARTFLERDFDLEAEMAELEQDHDDGDE